MKDGTTREEGRKLSQQSKNSTNRTPNEKKEKRVSKPQTHLLVIFDLTNNSLTGNISFSTANPGNLSPNSLSNSFSVIKTLLSCLLLRSP